MRIRNHESTPGNTNAHRQMGSGLNFFFENSQHKWFKQVSRVRREKKFWFDFLGMKATISGTRGITFLQSNQLKIDLMRTKRNLLFIPMISLIQWISMQSSKSSVFQPFWFAAPFRPHKDLAAPLSGYEWQFGGTLCRKTSIKKE